MGSCGYKELYLFRMGSPALDLFPKAHIIQRNLAQPMNTNLFGLILVVVLAVLIIKDHFVVGMAKVRAK